MMTLWKKANLSQSENGWTYSFDEIQRVQKLIREQNWEEPNAEAVEIIMAEADRLATTRPAPKADRALVGEPDRNQPHPLSQMWADAFHAWENGSHWDACETLRAALSDRDVVLEANKRLQKQSDFHDETARRMGQKLRAVVQIVQDEKRKAADIALEGGERAKANESMEAALGRALNRIESELVGAADA